MECNICLDLMDVTHRGTKTLRCNHTFHTGCINKWMMNKKSCPVCRKNIYKLETRKQLEDRYIRSKKEEYESILEDIFYECEYEIDAYPIIIESMKELEKNYEKIMNWSCMIDYDIDISDYIFDITLLYHDFHIEIEMYKLYIKHEDEYSSNLSPIYQMDVDKFSTILKYKQE